MTDKEILTWCKSIDKNQEYFVFSEGLFETLNVEQAKLITNYFDKRKLILLPVKEIEFFEWLKIAEPTVWHDLWDGELAQPYLVGIGFLPLLIYSEKRGFPICGI
jgi:hypothetical protein